MKLRNCFSLFLLIVVLLTSCVPGAQAPSPTVPAVTPTLPDPAISATHMPDARKAADVFLTAWKEGRYADMYGLLSQLSRDAITQDDFVNKYSEIAQTMTLRELDTEVLSALTNPGVAQVAYRVIYKTALVGDLQREMVMDMGLENGEWRIHWSDGMLLPDIAGGKRLAMDISVPARGNIYDSNGQALAAQSDAYALGIVPGRITEDMEGTLLAELSRLTGINGEQIASMYEFAGDDWYIAVGDAPAADVDARLDILTSSGAQVSAYNTRYYFGAAPHVVGYVQPIFAEELEEYKLNGYRGDEKVGKAGLEKWGEEYLAGERGAVLYVVNAEGQVEARLGQHDSKPAESVYTTLDYDFQYQVQKALEGFRGAAVVIERDSGKILAMASSPGFNPNLLDPNNVNAQMGANQTLYTEDNPMYNRATQGEYPLGSVFKIVTTAAALESNMFTQDSSYDCQHTFTEIIGRTYYDWTYEKEKPASGLLTLPEGLMRSCNPWFYHIGLELYNTGQIDKLSEMARSFGLGQATGMGQVAESEGNVPTPTSDVEAVEFGIGQAELLVTPLQVADFVAAVGNGGTLYRPQVVEKITDPDGNVTYEFKPEVRGTLPVSAENLEIIQNAMLSVVDDPRGTAHNVFLGMNAPIYGKTGTAQTSTGVPHAWFAGYTDHNREDKPNIAFAVIAENSGEGSEIAAPIARRILEIFYSGRPTRLYPWEASFYVTRTPTSNVTDTPEPEGAPTETVQP